MPVSGLDHVGVVVRDLDAALAAYRRRFGLSLVGQHELPDVGVRFAFLRAGDGSLVQLLEPIGPGPLREFLDATGGGMHHLCYAVDDIPAAMAEIAPGVPFTMHSAAEGRRACFLPDRIDGTQIELIETAPHGAAAAAWEDG